MGSCLLFDLDVCVDAELLIDGINGVLSARSAHHVKREIE